MSSEITIIRNVAEPNEVERHEFDCGVLEFLTSHFEQWPENSRLYADQVSESADITPTSQLEWDALKDQHGEFYLVQYPEGVLATLGLVIGLKVLQFALQPKPDEPQRRRGASPNNGLSDRENRARPNERIPDIFGTVNSTPDLIAPTYNVYENNRQVEYSLMCIGRGEYEIDPKTVKDDTTPLTQITGASASIYGPYTSPNSGAAQLDVGTPVDHPVYDARDSNAVNGQILRAPNADSITGKGNLFFVYPDTIQKGTQAEFAFDEFFAADDVLRVTGATHSDGTTSVNLNGVYTVVSVTDSVITLSNPSTVRADWNLVQNFAGQQTPGKSAQLTTTTDKWIGPFVLDGKDLDRAFVNLTAPQGLYFMTVPEEEGEVEQQVALDIDVEVELKEVDIDDNPIGVAQVFTGTLEGSSKTTDARNLTVFCEPVFAPSRMQVRVRRVTEQNLERKGRQVTEVQWESVYGVKDVPDAHFGNVTLAHVKTHATSGALSVKQRKFNLVVQRKVTRTVGGALEATNQIHDILHHIAHDKWIGRLTEGTLDSGQIFNTLKDVREYFGGNDADGQIFTTFNGTFDDHEMSFEETVATLLRVAFCRAYRLGAQIMVDFEHATPNSLMLFNHRNIIPETIKRTITLGPQNEYDGVEVEYQDEEDGALVTYYLPEDQSAVNATALDYAGLRNKLQARTLAHRELNKINHRHEVIQFDATEESSLLLVGQRIAIADGTRDDIDTGDILDQDGLTLKLSQPMKQPNPTHIFLQLSDKTTQAIGIVVESTDEVRLVSAPRIPLISGDAGSVQTVYTLAYDGEFDNNPYLVTEIEAGDDHTNTVTAVRYSNRFYDNDKDFITGAVDANGETIEMAG